MIGRLRTAVLAPQRRSVLLLLVATLLGALGLAAWLIGRQVWADVHYRRAMKALQQADLMQRRANLALAREHLADCLRIWPDSAETHFQAARAARRAGDSEDARQHLDRAAKLGWVAEAIELEQALSRAQQGDVTSVERVLADFVEEGHPDKVLILEALAQGYMRTYQLPHALACLHTLLQVQPDAVPALLWRGQVRLLMGKADEALDDYRHALELDPEEDAARQKVGDLLLAAHKAAEALPHFVRLCQRRPDDAEAGLGRARCLLDLRRTKEAADLLDALVLAHPEHAAILRERGKVALDAGDAAAAEKWLRRSYALAPFEHETAYSLHQCLQRLGQQAAAQEFQELGDRIDADRKRLEELKRAVSASPHDPSLRCEMGRILLRNRQDREGLRWLESALREDPRHTPTREALAKYYRDTSRPRSR
jgi:tetratricopeptide (TPR) repeat protein